MNRPVPSDASLAQIAAANPDDNVWLVANAGSGKTRVLTDRVARLLLRGVDPQNILCLTYTKAAAAEMQNRLFKRLGEWAMAPEGPLRDSLADLGEGDLPPEQLRLARQLFARAIETPGGIRIQTIHSFAGSLLRRFPLEAGVSPGFQEIDDRSAAQLRADVLDVMAEGPDSALLETVLEDSGEDLDALARAVIGRKTAFEGRLDEAALRASFGLPKGLDRAALLAQVFLGSEAALLAAILPALKSGTVTDAKAAGVVETLPPLPSLAALRVLEGLLLTGSGAKAPYSAKIGSFPTKKTAEAIVAHRAALENLMARVESARPLRMALEAAEAAVRLHRFARAFLRRYEAAKSARGWLDFDDLILRATDLLTDPLVAPWVLFRLDGNLDHVLVDEAQDTSPGQWRIIEALTQEFTAGEGARRVPRSLFVVGDKKQSIYSFQGADVAAFDDVKGKFSGRFNAAKAPLQQLPLQHSFRSSRAILDLVDRCFDGPASEPLGGAFRHLAFHEDLPGRVDIWPAEPPPEKPEEGAWYEPVDLMAENNATVVLARRIAGQIAKMIETGVQIPDDPKTGTFRPVQAGDFLILVQRRKEVFAEIIRACKAANLPIAGADRLILTDDLAVRDILSLLAFLNTPEDDLALATALRSPLFGWSEKRLFRLAQSRKGYLWEALRNDPAEVETVAVLHDLRNRAEFLRPYELIDRVLTRHGRRPMILGRMGAEAAEALDELQAQALAYERSEVPSLTGFLAWMQAGEVEVKRRPEAEGGLIRVMTVHGAKGLEAPIVILPDTADRRLDDRDAILPVADGVPVWAGRKEDNPAVVAAAKAERSAARKAENLRLLYVALTRAKSWLIVAAAGECGPESWYGMVERGAATLPLQPLAEGVRRLQVGHWPTDAPAPVRAKPEIAAPDWALVAASPPPAPLAEVSPSALGGEKVVAGEPLDAPGYDPVLRGSLLHLLLEHLPGLPQADWAALAEQIGALDVLDEAKAILSEQSLTWLFQPGTLAEVAVSAPWNGAVLAGSIDRLVVTPDVVTAIDYKSNRRIPTRPEEVPEAYLRQLGAYAHALHAIYPDRRIETAILWTRGPVLMPLSLDIVRAALGRAAMP
ncbi:double-strand break repair helicase AddA [Pseudogemmobacter blasticus]|uniref:DNA 3'-5' helicase n=1 Tax=Fuscovulum blasticum DSM 2131 TaxID=1188250 RepID=A0A2T4JFC5_FUSBL|nr:double-strand break repair helicase AddA [Fuscovulum blasticum]PTE16596.1 double-strand break repair helicase AddA [Fuscovulum blasticum DSM 2131]